MYIMKTTVKAKSVAFKAVKPIVALTNHIVEVAPNRTGEGEEKWMAKEPKIKDKPVLFEKLRITNAKREYASEDFKSFECGVVLQGTVVTRRPKAKMNLVKITFSYAWFYVEGSPVSQFSYVEFLPDGTVMGELIRD